MVISSLWRLEISPLDGAFLPLGGTGIMLLRRVSSVAPVGKDVAMCGTVCVWLESLFQITFSMNEVRRADLAWKPRLHAEGSRRHFLTFDSLNGKEVRENA